MRGEPDDRDLLDRAAAALGIDRSSFLLSQGRLAAQRVLADCETFVLDAEARSLPGLARLAGAHHTQKASEPAAFTSI